MSHPCETVEYLARCLQLGAFKWSNRMAMYSAYFDESGHPDSGRYLVVAGAVADVRQWTHLEREWKGALRPLGISVFHAVDFAENRAPYNGLTGHERTNLLMLLVGIIRRRVARTIAVAVDLGQHRATNEKY